MKSKGKYIVIEGVNTCGKTKQIDMLYECLKKNNIPVEKRAEPTHHLPIGKITREIYLPGKRKADNLLMAHLIAMDRYDQTVNPDDGTIKVLNEGKWVIQDRNYLSSAALDITEGSKYGIEYVCKLNEMTTNLLKADVIFVIDTSVETLVKRQAKRKYKDYFESEEMIRRSWKNYKVAINYLREKYHENIIPINGDTDPMTIHNTIWNHIFQMYHNECPGIRLYGIRL